MEQSNTFKHLPSFISKMEKEGIQPFVIDTFVYYYKKLVTGATGLLPDKDLTPVAFDDIKDADNLSEYADAGKRALKNTVMIILNGGLGTSMGLAGAKSLLEVKNGKTFLEILVEQARMSNVKLSFMNSYNTHKDTLFALSRIKPPSLPVLFLQHKFPKILKEGFAPAVWQKNPELEWNPPGHGDIYTALYTSGALQAFIDEGIIYAFISNSDNLGATIDEPLLGYFSENGFPFLMEVAQRTPADIKGGHLARHINGRLILREAAQCPENEIKAFQDSSYYKFFNTNNLWINLRFLKELIEKHGTIRLPVILNPKTIDPKDESTPGVYQIETAMGAAISLFEGATAVKVPKFRFFPVKKCSDLLAVRSDCFVFSKEKKLIINPHRKLDTIRIRLDPKYYGKIDLFNARFANGAPSLIACETLIINGDVFFERDVTIKGRVIITNTGNSQAVIKEGSVIDSDLNLP